MERASSSPAEEKPVCHASSDCACGFGAAWKPVGPDLDRQFVLGARVIRAAATSRSAEIHQQIAKPPRPAVVSQPQPDEPDLVSPPHRCCRENFIDAERTLLFPARYKISSEQSAHIT